MQEIRYSIDPYWGKLDDFIHLSVDEMCASYAIVSNGDEQRRIALDVAPDQEHAFIDKRIDLCQASKSKAIEEAIRELKEDERCTARRRRHLEVLLKALG